jgi:hypothetical protein
MTLSDQSDTSAGTDAQDTAACLGCGYALRGLTQHACPECGRAFDPADPDTMAGADRARVSMWLANTPMGWMMASATAALVLVLLWNESRPGGQFPTGCFAVIVLAATGFSWVIRVASQINTPERFSRSWLTAPLIVITALLLIHFDLPVRARFALSRPAMERQLGLPSSNPMILGLYDVRQIEMSGQVTLFYTGTSFLYDVGLMHVPADGVHSETAIQRVDLGGGWWTFERGW